MFPIYGFPHTRQCFISRNRRFLGNYLCFLFFSTQVVNYFRISINNIKKCFHCFIIEEKHSYPLRNFSIIVNGMFRIPTLISSIHFFSQLRTFMMSEDDVRQFEGYFINVVYFNNSFMSLLLFDSNSYSTSSYYLLKIHFKLRIFVHHDGIPFNND